MVLTLLLLVLAPLSVVATLSDVRVTFLVYHLGFCLILPLAHSLATGRGLRGHGRFVGFDAPSRRSVLEGAATGLLLGGGVVAFFALGGSAVLEPGRVASTMAAWGVDAGEKAPVIAFMLLLNGPAEELFWRGWMHRRLADALPRTAAFTVGTLGYASYHLVTLRALMPAAGMVALGFAAVAAAGLWWTWRRERRGDVWVPLLGHAGATVGYMVVYLGFAADGSLPSI